MSQQRTLLYYSINIRRVISMNASVIAAYFMSSLQYQEHFFLSILYTVDYLKIG